MPHPQEDGDLRGQGHSQPPPSPFAVLQKTAEFDPRFPDSPQDTQKRLCHKVKGREVSWALNPKSESHVSNSPSKVKRFLKGAVGNVNLSLSNPRTGIRMRDARLR